MTEEEPVHYRRPCPRCGTEVTFGASGPAVVPRVTSCLSCGAEGLEDVLSLGLMPLANAYPQRDGPAAVEATAHPGGSAAWAAAMFPGARWVKAFNTVNYRVLEAEAHRAGDRVGIPLASDDASALEAAATLARDAGFDPVKVGALARGKEFEPNTPMYNTGKSGRELKAFFG
jgi:hypothetical protein